MPEPAPATPWRSRLLQVESDLPQWAADAADRLLYASNRGGCWDLWTARLDRGGRGRCVTAGPRHTPQGAIDPAGQRVWWFADDRGDEWGRWCVAPFDDDVAAACPGLHVAALPAGYAAGLAVQHDVAAVGIAAAPSGVTAFRVETGRAPVAVFRSPGHARVAALSRDGESLCVEQARPDSFRHRALHVLDPRGRSVAVLDHGAGHTLHAVAWQPGTDDPALLVLHDLDDAIRPALWHPRRGSLQQIRLEGPGDALAAWYPDGERVAVLRHHRGGQRLEQADLRRGRVTPLALPAVCDQQRVELLDLAVRPDDALWLTCSGPSLPRQTIGPDGPVVAAATPPSHGQGNRGSGPAAATGRAGRAAVHEDVAGIDVLVTQPDGSPPWPTIVLLHGGPAREARDDWQPDVQSWVDEGVLVVRPNYRGSAGSGRRWRDRNLGDAGGVELTDLAAVHDWLLASGRTDARRLALAGYSWGGYLTLLGLARQPARWSAGIARMPIADPATLLEDAMQPMVAMDVALFGGTPEQRPARYRERSPLHQAHRIRAPLLLLAGRNDPRCPPRQNERLLTRLRELGVEHEAVWFDGGHAPLSTATRVALFARELAFLRRHFGSAREA